LGQHVNVLFIKIFPEKTQTTKIKISQGKTILFWDFIRQFAMKPTNYLI
jgi:hypothetical protein